MSPNIASVTMDCKYLIVGVTDGVRPARAGRSGQTVETAQPFDPCRVVWGRAVASRVYQRDTAALVQSLLRKDNP